MKKTRPYVGQIKNTGNQVVKGPYAGNDAKKGTVQKGNDLRGGAKGK